MAEFAVFNHAQNGNLGHCLVLLQDFDEAYTACRQGLKVRLEGGHVVVHHHATCDLCPNRREIKGSRFVCKTCPDMDLCESCMADYERRDMTQMCHGHSFLKIDKENVEDGPSDQVNELGESRIKWLKRLAQKYKEDSDFEQV